MQLRVLCSFCVLKAGVVLYITAAIYMCTLLVKSPCFVWVCLFKFRRSSAGPSTEIVSTDALIQAQVVKSAQLADYSCLDLLPKEISTDTDHDSPV